MKKDQCGVCGGDGTSCLSGCDRTINSTLVDDECGVCGGDNSTCKCMWNTDYKNNFFIIFTNFPCSAVPFYLNERTIAITAGTVGGVMVGVAACK